MVAQSLGMGYSISKGLIMRQLPSIPDRKCTTPWDEEDDREAAQLRAERDMDRADVMRDRAKDERAEREFEDRKR